MTTVFSGIIADMSAAIADAFDGRDFELTTAEGQVLSVPGIFKKAHRELSFGDYGAKTWHTAPRLDLRRSSLLDIGISDPDQDLHGAAVSIDGIHYVLAEVRDGEAFVRCLLSLDFDRT